jgi:outer membrane protein
MNALLRQCVAGMVFGGLLVLAPVQAQEFRIGFVNTDRIFKEASTAKAAQAKLEQEFSKLEREGPTLPEGQKTVRQKQLLDQDRELQRKRREFQEDLTSRKNEELQQVLERANRVVKQVAEAEKYDLVLQEAVYVNPKHDITDKVIKSLNAGGVK